MTTENVTENSELEKYVREIVISYKNPLVKSNKMLGPDIAVDYCRRAIGDNLREHFLALFLDGQNRIISYSVVSIGTQNQCQISTREILTRALYANAMSIIIAHNHPSGDCEPSKDDLLVTQKVKEACDLMQMKLLDSLVFSEESYISMIN